MQTVNNFLNNLRVQHETIYKHNGVQVPFTILGMIHGNKEIKEIKISTINRKITIEDIKKIYPFEDVDGLIKMESIEFELPFDSYCPNIIIDIYTKEA
jgi:hypothetical protein